MPRGAVGQVVDVIVAGRGRGLKNDVAGVALDADRGDLLDPLLRLRVDDDDGLGLRLDVAPPPRDAHAHGVGRLHHADQGPVTAEVRVERPGADGARDVSGAADTGHEQSQAHAGYSHQAIVHLEDIAS